MDVDKNSALTQKAKGEKKVKQARILLIDDEAEITEIIETFLTDTGYQILSENSSVMGIERAKTFKPDLILLDIMMPFMDGYDVCDELKKNKETEHIPVIFLTGKDPRSDEGKSFDVGGNMYIKKPFNCNRLLEIVRIVLMSINK